MSAINLDYNYYYILLRARPGAHAVKRRGERRRRTTDGQVRDREIGEREREKNQMATMQRRAMYSIAAQLTSRRAALADGDGRKRWRGREEEKATPKTEAPAATVDVAAADAHAPRPAYASSGRGTDASCSRAQKHTQASSISELFGARGAREALRSTCDERCSGPTRRTPAC